MTITCIIPEISSAVDRAQLLSFYPTNNLKNQNFEKMKKMPGDSIILHLCTTNENHMMHGS